jgi:hypothetical protein
MSELCHRIHVIDRVKPKETILMRTKIYIFKQSMLKLEGCMDAIVSIGELYLGGGLEMWGVAEKLGGGRVRFDGERLGHGC